MEAEAREMSRLAMKAADMSRRVAEAARRSCRAAEAARRSRRIIDASDLSGRAAEVEEKSRHTANAAEMSSRIAAAWENVSWAGKDSYRRMHVIVHSQMDQISGWMKLQDELNALFEQLRADCDLLRAKIAGRAKQEEETAAVLQRTGVIINKLMDENDMLRIERERLVEESAVASEPRIKDTKLMKEIIVARGEN